MASLGESFWEKTGASGSYQERVGIRGNLWEKLKVSQSNGEPLGVMDGLSE